MKSVLAFLGIGSAWILFTGLVGTGVIPLTLPFPQTYHSPPTTDVTQPTETQEQNFPSFAKDLQEGWISEHLLATSA